MRWIWIDKIIELEPGKRIVAVKNVSLVDEVVHNHFAADTEDVKVSHISDEAHAGKVGDSNAFALGAGPRPLPIMPAPLLIEGMAQTAGILVGHANKFAEKVILAKITKAKFEADVVPGQTVRYEAVIENMDPSGAAATGTITVYDFGSDTYHHIANIDLMFSHIDQNRAGTQFPDENFVFTQNFRTLLISSGVI